MIWIPLAFIIVFNYVPIMGIVIAFKNFKPGFGILGSPMGGASAFPADVPDGRHAPAFRNTLIIAVMKVIANLVFPIIFALLLNEVCNIRYKRTVQTITYLPYFLSWVVLSGILIDLLSPAGALSTA
jgi:putative aldouronate transport system permease protein